MPDQLGEQAFRQAFPPRLFDPLPDPLHLLAGRQDLENAVEVDAIVPDVQRTHRGVVGHMLAVGAHGFRRRLRRLAVEQPDVMGGDDDAGRQPLDVPLPRRRQGLVEIVDVEEDVALGGGEAAEIHEVSVAASLHAKPGGGGRGEVGRHDRSRAAIEGEWRLRHAPEADRDQLRNPAFIGLVQKLDRIAPVLGRLPAALRCARRGVAQRLPRGAPFVRGYVTARETGGVVHRIRLRFRPAHARAPSPLASAIASRYQVSSLNSRTHAIKLTPPST